MRRAARALAIVATALLIAAASANATPVTVSFTAAGFVSLTDPLPPTEDPVSGTIVYDAASSSAPIDSLLSISLALGGHTYALGEVGFLTDLGTGYIGGLIDGVTGSGNFEDDFLIIWDMVALVPLQFLYAVAGSSGIWYTSDFARFAVTVASAPEPDTLALLALALSTLMATRERGHDVFRRAAKPAKG